LWLAQGGRRDIYTPSKNVTVAVLGADYLG
jgi:hypothetical protein